MHTFADHLIKFGSVDVAELQKAHTLMGRWSFPTDDCELFQSFVDRVKALRMEEIDDEDVPEEYCCEIIGCRLTDPVNFPDSHHVVERKYILERVKEDDEGGVREWWWRVCIDDVV
jgi:hypothetical protein